MNNRVAIYLPSLRGGGAERIMVILAQEFAERGIKVDLVLAKAEGPYLADVHDSARIVDLGAPRVLASLPGLVRYLRRERPRAMLSALNHANVVALLACRLARTPTRLVVSERENLSVSVANYSGRRRLMPHFIRWTYPWAEKVVTVSGGVADDLLATTGLSASLISVIYNPVVSDNLFQQALEPVDNPWFAPASPPVILGVGRLTAQKDFKSLIRAFAVLRRERPARLLILGEGEERPALEGLVQELGLETEVALHGFVQNPFAYMRRAAVFVLSSRWEGLPGVLIQAMACGTPVVSTDCPSGPAEILENGLWGRLVPVADVTAMAEAITETLDERAHQDVAQRAGDFSVSRAVDAYLDVLQLVP